MSPLTGLLPETSETAALLSASAHAAEALLRESPALRTALSVCLHAQVPMLLVWGRDARCIYNDACIAVLGPRHPAAFGQPLAALTNASVGDGAQATKTTLDLATWSCSPVLQSGKRLGALYVGVAASTAGVSGHHHSDCRDSFLLMLEDALQHVSDPRRIIDTSMRLLGEHLHANRCAFGLVAADGSTLHVISDHVQDMPSLQGDFPLEAAQGLRDALLENRPWFTTDTMTPGAPDYVAEQYRHSGLRASLAIPLHKHGRLVAAIGVHQRAPRHWLSTEIELVRLVAARCWESMQRAKAQQQLAGNEARLRRLANTLPQIIFIADPDGRPHYFNQRWYEYTGLDPSNNEDAAWHRAHTADGLRLSAQAWTLALNGKRAFEMECELLRHDGQSRWHLARALPVRGDDGSISEWIGTYTDIHDRRAFEQQLRESEVRFRALCETVPAMIWMSDAQGDCVYWNPRWYDFTGQGEDQALDQAGGM